jgi:hypothetical protein
MDRGLVSRLRDECGTSLLEVLVALMLVAMGMLAVAPMFVSSLDSNATGADISSLSGKATARMESLRAEAFHALTPGGSLTSNVSGYSDTSDSQVILRWEIVDGGGPSGTRSIQLVAFRLSQLSAQPSSVLLTTLRSR